MLYHLRQLGAPREALLTLICDVGLKQRVNEGGRRVHSPRSYRDHVNLGSSVY